MEPIMLKPWPHVIAADFAGAKLLKIEARMLARHCKMHGPYDCTVGSLSCPFSGKRDCKSITQKDWENWLEVKK